MTIQLELDPELEQQLTDAAQMHQQPVEAYLKQIVGKALTQTSPRTRSVKTREEFLAAVRRLRKHAPPVPPNADIVWSRESLYDDHD